MSESLNITDHKDSVLYMMMRRQINEEFAEQPVDFNAEGFEAGQRLLRRPYTDQDIIADIGSSSGEMIAEAALCSGIAARVLCIEPDGEAFDAHLRLPVEQQQRIAFLQGTGEAIPLQDSVLAGATIHNVIFRAKDSRAMVSELKRVVMPGGFIAISSNARGHAYYRHQFEIQVAKKVMEISGIEFSEPEPPAEGHYLEDLPALIKDVGDLDIRDSLFVSQDTHAVITRGQRLEIYLDSIKYSAANTDLPDEHRTTWRKVVDFWVKTFIEDEISKAEEVNKLLKSEAEPYFADPIRRGMFVMRNVK